MTDNQINKLPKNWTLKTLGDCISKVSTNGIKLRQKEYLQEGKYPVIDQGQDFIGGHSDDENLLINCELPVVIFGDHTKVKKFVDFNFIVGADGVKVLKSKPELDPKFFFYGLHTIQITDKGYARHFQDLEKKMFPLPPLPEQQKIVQKIESLFTELETGTKALKTALAQLKIYRQAVLNHFLTNDKWEIVRLKDVNLFITDGDHQAPPKAEKGIPFVVISNIKNNKLDLSKTRFVTDEYYENLSEYRKAQKGDILYTVTGSYGIPVLLISEEKFCFQRHIGLLKPNTDKINREYLFYCLCSQFVFKQATNVATGTAQLTVPLSGLRNIKIPLPSLKIQTQIVSEIENRMAGADALEASLKAQLINAENLRQSILKRAFEGKLV